MKSQSNRLPPIATPNAFVLRKASSLLCHSERSEESPHFETLRFAQGDGNGPSATKTSAGYIVRGGHTARRGFTLLEFVVALLLFGLAMSGLFPMVVMYSRVLELLEQRPDELLLDRNQYRVDNPDEWYQVPADPPVPNSGEWVHKWYLVPSSDSASDGSNAWARKLGASASIRYESPTSTTTEDLTVPTTADITVDYLEGDYTEVAEWTDYDPAATDAHGGNQRHPVESVDSTAIWTFTVVNAGWYRVEATGVESGGETVLTGTYKLSYGATEDEDVTPTTNHKFETWPGTEDTWCLLTTKYFSAGTVTVELTTSDTAAIADAMRIVRCSVQVESWTPPTTETAGATVEIKPAVRTPPE